MRNLEYNNAAQTLRLEFPDEWNPPDISAVTLTILDRDGTELLAASACTLYTATSLDGDANRYASTITLDSAAGALVQGDRIFIAGEAGNEKQTVRGQDLTSEIVTLEGILYHDHVDGDVVDACWCTISVDTSTVATFTAGLPITLLWTPTGSGSPFTESAQIAKTTLSIEGLEERFRAVWSRAYEDFINPQDKFSIMRAEAERQLKAELLSDGLNMDRIIDQDRIAPVLMARMAYMWTLNGDVNKEDERKAIGDEYNKLVAQLKRDPIWQDSDQDFVEDEEVETTSHETYFERGW